MPSSGHHSMAFERGGEVLHLLNPFIASLPGQPRKELAQSVCYAPRRRCFSQANQHQRCGWSDDDSFYIVGREEPPLALIYRDDDGVSTQIMNEPGKAIVDIERKDFMTFDG